MFNQRTSKLDDLREAIIKERPITEDMPPVSDEFIEWFADVMLDPPAHNFDKMKENGTDYEYYMAGRRSVVLALIEMKLLANQIR